MRKYFITGLLILVPLVITVWVLKLILTTMDQSLLLLPEDWQPNKLFGFQLTGMGEVLTVLVVFLTGVLARNFIGTRIVHLWERLLGRIPIVNSIYSSVKQVSDTLFSESGNAFRTAVLIQWPHEGMWTIAFVTGAPGGDVVNHLQGDYLGVYVPTTPNPTGGYFVMLKRSDCIELKMSVDEALKYIVSMGVVVPGGPGSLPTRPVVIDSK